MSPQYQNFFSFQNVTSPPHAVNVPLISSQGRHYIRIYQHDSFISHVGRLFPIVFFTWSWIQFLKEIVLIMRNCYITMSEIELVFRRAELRCSGSLYSMLLFKKMYLIQIFNQYLLNKKDDICRPMDTNLSVWIELSL